MLFIRPTLILQKRELLSGPPFVSFDIYGRIPLSAPVIRSAIVYISVTFPTISLSINP